MKAHRHYTLDGSTVTDGRRMLKHKKAIIFCATVLLLFLSACAQSNSVSSQNFPIGGLWEVPVEDNGEANWGYASSIANEQHAGYTLARENLEDNSFQDIISGESNQQGEIQVAIREMVEDEEKPVVAVIGATTNEATMRAASLVNFFNVPMLVPSANGDNLLPSNNIWAFRLSAPGFTYANYMFGSVLTKINLIPISGAVIEPSLKIAILYEQNTFGESAAVATARAAMLQEIEIGVYASFSSETIDPDRMVRIMENMAENNVHLAYLITSDPAAARTLVQIFHSRFFKDAMPILVGQAGGFASAEFLESDEAESVYVVRQELVKDQCPTDIESLYEAQAYAAVYLLDQAVKQVEENQPAKQWYEWQAKQTEIAVFREEIRDALKQIRLKVPCLGMVAFDNTGQNKLLNFELVTVKGEQLSILETEDFLNSVRRRAGQLISQ
ncbi:MAG: hypothetical protein B6243_03695 [Anaerolineaceae bacterium 4572_5.2]|nr:MAG: hypothetical protein B6243_03695 [Anaerolineaceae bacterium 4572_5.2]